MTRFAVSWKTICLGLLAGFYLAVSCSRHTLNDTKEKSVYENRELGLRLVLGRGWKVFTSRKEAPKDFRSEFKEGKLKTESPLFVAMSPDEQFYARLLVEEGNPDLEDYLQDLIVALRLDSASLMDARIYPEYNSLDLRYAARVQGYDIVFQERLVALENKNILRLTFWSLADLAEKFSLSIDTFYTQVYRQAGTSWEPLWGDLDVSAGIPLPVKMDTGSTDTLDCPGKRKAFFWRVVDENNAVYLFGSIHVGKPEFYPLTPVVEAAFERADYLVFEIDPGGPQFSERMREVMALGLLDEGDSLRHLVSPELYEQLEAVAAELGLPMKMFGKFKPWLIAMTLAQYQLSALGYQPKFGVEQYLIRQRNDSQEILELETLEQQVQAFLDAADGENFLEYTLATFNDAEQKIEKMIRAWRCGDGEAMSRMLFDDQGLDAETHARVLEKLIYKRNAGMAEKIKSYLAEEGDIYFVVMGTGHLLDSGSVVDLLTRDGYRVERLVQSD